MRFHDLFVATRFATVPVVPAWANCTGGHVRCRRQQIPYPPKKIRLPLAAALAAIAILGAGLPGRAQCSAAGNWQGTWGGVNAQGYPKRGTISATFTQTGTNFTGSVTVLGKTISDVSGSTINTPNTTFTFTSSNSIPQSYSISVTAQFNAICSVITGSFISIANATGKQAAKGTFMFTNAVTITLLDPVPGLVTGYGSDFSIDPNPTLLSVNGTAVTGVSADGVTQAVVMISNLSASQQVTLNVTALTTAGDPDNVASGQDGSLKTLLPSDSSAPGTSLTLTAVPVGNTNMAFAVLIPPIDYSRNDPSDPASTTEPNFTDVYTASRQITLQVQDTSGNQLSAVNVMLFRPPIMTVNGVWEDKTAWSYVQSYLTGFLVPNGTNTPVTIWMCQADYSSSVGAIVDQAGTLLGGASRCLRDFKSQNQAAAGQLDVFAHGSAGLALYSASASPAYHATETYGKGYYHKLITLETPYYGSEYAGYLVQYGLPDCSNALAQVGVPMGEAVYDMAPQSSWMQAFMSAGLPTSFPKHALSAGIDLGGVLPANNINPPPELGETDLVNSVVNENAPDSACSSVFSVPASSPPHFNLSSYFGGYPGRGGGPSTYSDATDLVSTVWSQLGPLANYSTLIFGASYDLFQYSDYNANPWPFSINGMDCPDCTGIAGPIEAALFENGPRIADDVRLVSDYPASGGFFAH